MITSAYRSKFLKADTRHGRVSAASKVYSTGDDGPVAIDDIFIPAGAILERTLTKSDLHIIFPIVGGVIVSAPGDETGLYPEELYCVHPDTLQTVWLENPFRGETINLLHIRIDKKAHNVKSSLPFISPLKLDTKNRLVQGEGSAHIIQAGIYDSRVKDKVPIPGGHNAVLSYIINGSFDIEERLMEYRDGLFQWDVEETDIEALSETAIILLVHCSHSK